MNIFTFTGNLGRDAEVRHLPNGGAVCSFSVAVKSGFGDKAKTTWVSCGLFGKRAEGQLPGYLVKGAQVCISGEAFLDEWEKDGQINKMLKVNVDKLDLIGGNQQQAPQRTQQQRPAQAPQRPAPQQQAPQQQRAAKVPQQQQNFTPDLDDGWDDDIPF